MGARIVVDTNVLVSALGWRGTPHLLLRSCFDGRCQLLLSAEILTELEAVLHYPKLGFEPEEILEYLETLTEIAELVVPQQRLELVEKDPSDNKFLECALAGRADAVISGDGHLKALGSVHGIPVLSPRDWLSQL